MAVTYDSATGYAGRGALGQHWWRLSGVTFLKDNLGTGNKRFQKNYCPEFEDQPLKHKKSYLEQGLGHKEVYHSIIYNPKKTKQTKTPTT